MHQNIRRGLLGTLFAGGLLALGTTAASAADTTTGSDGLLSGTQVNAPVTAPITLGATSLGLLGDSAATTDGTPTTVGQPAPAPAPGNSTTGSDGLLSGTQVNTPVTAPITLGAAAVGVVGESSTAVVNQPTENQPTENQPAVAPGAGAMASGSLMVPAAAPGATLAHTGASTDLLWVALLFVGAGLFITMGGLRKRA